MKKLVICLALLSLFAAPALAGTYTYGWENGAMMLGSYSPQLMYAANSTAQARTGTHSLEFYEIADPITGSWSGTPQAYVAWVTGLHVGDVVSATIYAWDPTASGSPSVRIWGHWTPAGGDVNSYLASAGGNSTYSSDYWVTPLSYSWTATTEGEGLMIEIRSYSGATGVGLTNYVDDLSVTIPDHDGLALYFPNETPVATKSSTWGAVKDLYK